MTKTGKCLIISRNFSRNYQEIIFQVSKSLVTNFRAFGGRSFGNFIQINFCKFLHIDVILDISQVTMPQVLLNQDNYLASLIDRWFLMTVEILFTICMIKFWKLHNTMKFLQVVFCLFVGKRKLFLLSFLAQKQRSVQISFLWICFIKVILVEANVWQGSDDLYIKLSIASQQPLISG